MQSSMRGIARSRERVCSSSTALRVCTLCKHAVKTALLCAVYNYTMRRCCWNSYFNLDYSNGIKLN